MTAAESVDPKLVIALDFPEAAPALAFMQNLRDSAGKRMKTDGIWAKVGLELFTASGPAVVKALKEQGVKVFLDMKFHDIPNTVRKAVRAAVAMGVDMTNIHLCGGERMVEGALEGLEDGVREYGRRRPILMGVTVLTSVGTEDFWSVGLFSQEKIQATSFSALQDEIAARAEKAKDWGLDGVVCSALEAERIKNRAGKNFLCLTPGIRPAFAGQGDDQRRVVTPAEAVMAGSDFLVVGRPITRSANPVKAVEAVLEEMRRSTAESRDRAAGRRRSVEDA